VTEVSTPTPPDLRAPSSTRTRTIWGTGQKLCGVHLEIRIGTGQMLPSSIVLVLVIVLVLDPLPSLV
jgi:hypothetical protein